MVGSRAIKENPIESMTAMHKNHVHALSPLPALVDAPWANPCQTA
jgi:hypothetical protein